MRLTKSMREALETAAKSPLRRLHDNQPGKPPWPAPHATLAALQRRELLAHNRRRTRKGWWLEEWTITDQGRRALEPPTPRAAADRSLFLARPSRSTGDYTNDRHRAIDDLETVDKQWLDKFAQEAQTTADTRLADRANGWEWERQLRAAEAAGVDTSRERLAIQRMVGRAQRKMQQRKAA